MNDYKSSDRRTSFSSVGLVSAYVIEVILGKENLVSKEKDYIITILGENSENLFWNGIVVDIQNKEISDKDLPKIQKNYQNWWEKNKDKSLLDLRERWKKGERILDGKEYQWN